MTFTLKFACMASFLATSLLIPISNANAQFQRFGGNPFQPPIASIHPERIRVFHVSNLTLHIILDPTNHTAEAVSVNTLTPLDHTLQDVTLDAGANLEIASCSIDGINAKFVHKADKLIITAPNPLLVGTYYKVETKYKVMPSVAGSGANGVGGVRWIDPDPAHPDRKPEFWTQGETRTNRDWVVCYDYPNDKCTSETVTTVPENWTVIGNGTAGPVTVDKANHTRTFTWTMTQPHSTYLLSLVAGVFDVQYGEWRGIPLIYEVPGGMGKQIPAMFGCTPDMLSFYSDILDFKYAWPKYAQDYVYDFPGGMENVSATTLGGEEADNRSGEFPLASLISHELAHQWFGDLVTCDNWGDIWLNEGFANFFDALYLGHLKGRDAYETEKNGYLRGYIGESHRYERPIVTQMYSNPDAVFDATTYDKGALVLAMLYHRLGHKMFFHCLHVYLTDFEYKPVNTEDLETVMSRVSGKNLTPFFDQWLYGPGHPILDTTWHYDPSGKQVVVDVKQLQSTADGVPIFHTPITFGLLFSSANEGKMVSIHEKLTSADQTFNIPVSEVPAALLVDPNHWLLAEQPHLHWTASELPAIFNLAPTYLDRLEAAKRLAALSTTLNQQTINEFEIGLIRDPSNYVKEFLISKLGTVNNPQILSIVNRYANSGPDRLRAAAISTLPDQKYTAADLQMVKAYASSKTAPYSLVTASLEALSKMDAANSMPVYAFQINQKSIYDQLARAVVIAMANVKSQQATDILIQGTASSHSPYTRYQAIQELQNAAPDNGKTSACLIALLNDKSPFLLRADLMAIKRRKVAAALPAMTELLKVEKSAGLKQLLTVTIDSLQANHS